MTSKARWFDREIAEANHKPWIYYVECVAHKHPQDIEDGLWESLTHWASNDLPEAYQVALLEYEDWWEDTHFYSEESFYACDDSTYGVLCMGCTEIIGDTTWPCEWYTPTQEQIERILQEPNQPSFPKTLEPPPLPTTLLGSPTSEQEAR